MENSAEGEALYERVPERNWLHRAFGIIILLMLITLLLLRVVSLHKHGAAWRVAFLCESWFTLCWIIILNTKWNPLDHITFPHRLLSRVQELPGVDLFVTTADPVLEPPLLTINTVLSLLAVDYPPDKLACYVSDDACSPLTLFSLAEASRFAHIWVPFCKKYRVPVRAPFRYFSSHFVPSDDESLEFLQERKRIKEEYELLSERIMKAVEGSVPLDLRGQFADFANTKRNDHPPIVKVIWENKRGVEGKKRIPHVVYISREKHPKHPHHYKAGAMNVLARVSGVMTNAPYMLNVDCDMFVNNPQILLHAMCLLLGSKTPRDTGFVQSPQMFYDGLKNDPFGNQFSALHKFVLRGIAGLQGPFYQGTGCFHRRKVIYGSAPDDPQVQADGEKYIEKLAEKFGNSKQLIESANQILSRESCKSDQPQGIASCIEAAHHVARCCYEYGTSWGKEVGWLYGSATEDTQTGIKIHSRGWRSVYCTPDPPAFLGCSPAGGSILLTQYKRWTTGFLEILFSRNCPLLHTLYGKLEFRMCIAYLWPLTWGLRSVPELFYALLPAFCIFSNASFLPKMEEPTILIPVTLYMAYNLYHIWEFHQANESIQTWWNNQKMARIISSSSWLFGFLSIILKLFGLSKTVFEVTQKTLFDSNNQADNHYAGQFTFNGSPFFVPGTTIVMINMIAFITGLLRSVRGYSYGGGESWWSGEMVCCLLVVLYFWPFLKGLFGKGKLGIPTSIILKSSALVVFFVQFCSWVSV